MIRRIGMRVIELLPPRAQRIPRGLYARLRLMHMKLARLRGYAVSPWSQAGARYLLFDRELANFTYDIANVDDLPRFVATSTGCSVDEAKRFLYEILHDDQLLAHLANRLGQRSDRNARPCFGRRLGWYCIARAVRPGLIVETGTHDGLGTSVLLRAAQRNASEGVPTRVITLDIDPLAGWLIPDHLKERLEVYVGDTRETLPQALGGQEVGMIIHDSEHTYEREQFELSCAVEHAAPSLVLISDNAHATAALSDLCQQLGIAYHYFAERPVRHFYPGAAIGLGVYLRP
jgi:hypothetical protein